MFGLGGSEIFTIVLVALLVFGPKQIPVIARNVKKIVQEFNLLRSHMRQTMGEVRREIDLATDVREELGELESDLGLKPALGTAKHVPPKAKATQATQPPQKRPGVDELDDYLNPAPSSDAEGPDDYLAGGAA